MYTTILYAADFDEVGENAAKKAALLAKENNAKLHMVHVIEPIPAYAYPGLASFSNIEASIKQQAEKSLLEMSEQVGVDKDCAHLALGSTKHEVLRLADELSADLILVGSHGKHGMQLILGSTATAILHGAHCDVLVVRNDKK